MSILLLIGLGGLLPADDFSMDIKQVEEAFGSNDAVQAFSTYFKYDYELIKKEWWRYIRLHALRDNRGDYDENKVLSRTIETEADIVFYSKIVKAGQYAAVVLALKEAGLSEKQKTAFNQYVRELLIDFKVNFFSGIMQAKIDAIERQASQTSTALERLYKSHIKLLASAKKTSTTTSPIEKQLAKNDNERELLRLELHTYRQQLEKLALELRKIK